MNERSFSRDRGIYTSPLPAQLLRDPRFISMVGDFTPAIREPDTKLAYFRNSYRARLDINPQTHHERRRICFIGRRCFS
jgi:hypothetical protein